MKQHVEPHELTEAEALDAFGALGVDSSPIHAAAGYSVRSDTVAHRLVRDGVGGELHVQGGMASSEALCVACIALRINPIDFFLVVHDRRVRGGC